MPSPGATPKKDYDALDLGRDSNGRWLIGTLYTDGSYVVWDADTEQEVAYIGPGEGSQAPVDLGGGRAAVVNPDGSLTAFDIANPPPQFAGAAPAGSGGAPAAPTNPHAPTGAVGTRNPGEDFNYGAIVGKYAPRFGGQTVSPTNAQTRGAGVEGIPYGWGVTGFGQNPKPIQESHQAGLADPALSPGYIPGSGRYNQYDLTDPKLAGGLFGTIPGQSGMVNLRYGLGGTGDPTTGGELQTPQRWITGNPNDSTVAQQGDAKWRETGGKWRGGGWAGAGGGGDAPPNALTGGNEYAGAGDLEALQVAEVQDAVDTGDPETIRRAGALAWAQGKISEQAYNQLCQQFVENAYGTGFGTPSMGQFRSAKLAAAGLGATRRPSEEMRPGDLVFFNPDRSNDNYGHVGLATEGDPGSFVSATAHGVKQDNYLTDPYWSRLYAGSAAPPSSWPGQGQASGGGWDQAFAGAPAYQPGPGVSAAGGWQPLQPGVSIRQPGTGGGGTGGGMFGSNVTSNWGQTDETRGLDFIATLFLRPDTGTGINTAAWSAPRQMWLALVDEIRKGRIYVTDPSAWQMLSEYFKQPVTPQSIGGAATGGQNVQPGGGSGTEDAIANGNAADAADRAAYWAYQQSLLRQGDTRIALEEARDAWTKAYQTAGLTGQFNGADTMAMQQQRFAQGVTEAGLTGTYQGQKTQQAIAQENAAAQALLSLQASLQGPRNWARYQSTFGSTPQGLKDVLAAYQGRYQLPTGQGAQGTAQGGRASAAGLAGDILSGTYGNDNQSGGLAAMGNPRQADIQNWARMQPSQREMILGAYEDQGWYGPDVENLMKGAAPRNAGSAGSAYNFFQQ